MLKVTIFQEYVPRYREGFFSSLVARALNMGIEIRVVIPNASSKEYLRKDGITGEHAWLTRLPPLLGKKQSSSFTYSMVEPLLKNQEVAIFEQARRNLALYRLLVESKRKRSTKIALWGHGKDSSKVGPIRRAVLAWLTRRADGIFVYTRQGAEHIAAKHKITASNTFVLNNVTDTQELRKYLAEIPVRGRNYRLKVLFMGSLVSSKGISIISSVVKNLSQKNINVDFSFAGAGPCLP